LAPCGERIPRGDGKREREKGGIFPEAVRNSIASPADGFGLQGSPRRQ